MELQYVKVNMTAELKFCDPQDGAYTVFHTIPALTMVRGNERATAEEGLQEMVDKLSIYVQNLQGLGRS
jgi:hypothetical protein